MNHLSIHKGDCLEALRTLPDQWLHCCVTSPPYWGLRDYGTAQWEGGDERCDHQAPIDAGKTSKPSAGQRQHAGRFAGPSCHRCGATRIDRQIGLEATLVEYVAKMVDVFREVRRVLRDDGTLWMNLGDSYASAPAGNFGPNMPAPADGGRYRENKPKMDYAGEGLKPKDLVGIPWMVAFALREDGWYLRSDIIWAKPNPMPESVTDRPTKSHEYLFLLSKAAKYYYDADAIREPWTSSRDDMRANGLRTGLAYLNQEAIISNAIPHSHRGSTFTNGKTAATKPNVGQGQRTDNPCGRNKRSVWTVATLPYPEAHFATFPPELIKPCILAGCPVAGSVLDPFAGSGTTGMVAIELGRKAVLIELNPEYCKLIEQRCNVTPGLPLPAA